MAYKNKEDIKTYNKIYRENHKDYFKNYLKKYKKKYRLKNSDRIKKYWRKWYLKNKDYFKKHPSLWRPPKEYYKTEKFREFNKKRAKKYRKKNPLKYKARYTLRNAITMGKITKPNFCSKCNNSIKIEAHHEDYSKPLDIIWLCKKCHGIADKNMI